MCPRSLRCTVLTAFALMFTSISAADYPQALWALGITAFFALTVLMLAEVLILLSMGRRAQVDRMAIPALNTTFFGSLYYGRERKGLARRVLSYF